MSAELSTSCKLSPEDSPCEPSRAEISTEDLHAVKEMDEAAHWDTEFYHYEKGPLQASVRLVETESAQVVENVFNKGVMVRGGIPGGTLVFGVLCSHEHRFQGVPVTPGDVAVVRSADELEYWCKGPTRLCTVAIGESDVAEAAEARWGVSIESLGKSSLLQLDAGRRLENLQNELAKLFRTPDLGPPCGATAALQPERLLDLLFRYLRPPAAVKESFAYRQRLARAAEEYLRSRASGPVSMTALCRELGARERTLYLGFRERYGMSPGSYVTMLRMNAAKRALVSAPPGSRVTDIALRAGFTHLGRFSAEYRGQFGEPPSATLSNSVQHTY